MKHFLIFLCGYFDTYVLNVFIHNYFNCIWQSIRYLTSYKYFFYVNVYAFFYTYLNSLLLISYDCNNLYHSIVCSIGCFIAMPLLKI